MGSKSQYALTQELQGEITETHRRQSPGVLSLGKEPSAKDSRLKTAEPSPGTHLQRFRTKRRVLGVVSGSWCPALALSRPSRLLS